MSSGPTYYDFFGISPKASAAQIRRAYLLCMKACHPDRVRHGEQRRASDFAAFANRCYAVLKDPAKRARYDAYLVHQLRGAQLSSVSGQASYLGEDRTSRWSTAHSTAFALLVSAVALVAIGAATVPSAPLERLAGRATLPGTPAFPTMDAMSKANIRDQLRLAMTATEGEAMAASSHCFQSARRQSSLYKTQLCVIFDDAYVDWNQIAGESPSQLPYFNDAFVRVRQRDAMAAVGSFQESRLDQLREITIDAMLAQVRSKLPDAKRALVLPR